MTITSRHFQCKPIFPSKYSYKINIIHIAIVKHTIHRGCIKMPLTIVHVRTSDMQRYTKSFKIVFSFLIMVTSKNKVDYWKGHIACGASFTNMISNIFKVRHQHSQTLRVKAKWSPKLNILVISRKCFFISFIPWNVNFMLK